MSLNVLRVCLIGIPLIVAGCLSPWTTRFPSLQREDPLAERQSFERFNPYPEEELGPDTNDAMVGQRRGFEPRTMPRRAKEGRMLLGTGAQPAPGTVQPPPSSWNYPNAVPQ